MPRLTSPRSTLLNAACLAALASAGPPTVSACKNTKYSDNTDIGASLNASPQNFIDSGGGGSLARFGPTMDMVNFKSGAAVIKPTARRGCS